MRAGRRVEEVKAPEGDAGRGGWAERERDWGTYSVTIARRHPRGLRNEKRQAGRPVPGGHTPTEGRGYHHKGGGGGGGISGWRWTRRVV